jgi:hypothetical protein
MVTGIVSISMLHHSLAVLSAVLPWVAAAGYAVLAGASQWSSPGCPGWRRAVSAPAASPS